MKLLLRAIGLAAVMAAAGCVAADQSHQADLNAKGRFIVDTSPPDCASGRDDVYAIDGVTLRFPTGLTTKPAYNKLSVALTDDHVALTATLVKHDSFRNATSVMTEIFPLWKGREYTTMIRGKFEMSYTRTTDTIFSTGLDMLAPVKNIPADIYFLQSTPDRIAPLIACPFNPAAVQPMMGCTLYKADNNGIGYEVEFQAAFLPSWREIEALAQDLIADAQVCGQS